MNKINLFIEKASPTLTPILNTSKNWGSVTTVTIMAITSLADTPILKDLNLSLLYGTGFACGSGAYRALNNRCNHSVALLASTIVGFTTTVAASILLGKIEEEQCYYPPLHPIHFCISTTLIATGLYALNHTINLAKNYIIRA